MNGSLPARASTFLASMAILAAAVSCGGEAPATTAPTTAPTAAPTVAAATPAPSPAQGLVLAHKAGEVHKLQPKRLESVIEIDMGDHYFANTLGVKNPTFTLPTGKTIGIHLHNEGTVMHEVVIGRTLKQGGDYEEMLTESVPSDIFFYYGEVKAEIGGALFGELEADQGIRDIWIRINVPAKFKGEWELGCFAPEHYEKGMHAKLIFQ